MEQESGPEPLRLESIAGPPLDPIVIEPQSRPVLGRSTASDCQLADRTVSRRHGRIERRGGQWFLTDLGSRHGTFLNGMRLSPDQPAPLNNKDLVRMGPWTLRALDGSTDARGTPTTDDLASAMHRVQRVPARELKSVAQQRLDLLIECAAGINAASELPLLAREVLGAITRGTGFERAAFIRPVSSGGDVEVVACVGPESGVSAEVGEGGKEPGGPARSGFTFSRSLLRAAADGEIVRMQGESGSGYGESVIRLGIHSALCAPVLLGDAVEAFIYLDAREGESAVQQDAAAFSVAVSRMAGLALANLRRVELESQRRRIDADLRAARQAQRLIMPPAYGRSGPIGYAMQNRPGRQVAGDLFDVVPRPAGLAPEHRAPGKASGGAEGGAEPIEALAFTPVAPDRSGLSAVFLGDVSGKGVGASILMAVAQTRLASSISDAFAAKGEVDLSAAVSSLNRWVAEVTEAGTFLSLFGAVIDGSAGTLTYVDAGHGHALIVPPGGEPHAPGGWRGTLVGIEPGEEYRANTVPFEPGSRLFVFSDGLLEQPDADGEFFGLDRVIRSISPAAEAPPMAEEAPQAARRDVQRLVDALESHAGESMLADDLTIACIVAHGG